VQRSTASKQPLDTELHRVHTEFHRVDINGASRANVSADFARSATNLLCETPCALGVTLCPMAYLSDAARMTRQGESCHRHLGRVAFFVGNCSVARITARFPAVARRCMRRRHADVDEHPVGRRRDRPVVVLRALAEAAPALLSRRKNWCGREDSKLEWGRFHLKNSFLSMCCGFVHRTGRKIRSEIRSRSAFDRLFVPQGMHDLAAVLSKVVLLVLSDGAGIERRFRAFPAPRD
jgi:hypothetical protein